MDDCSLLVPATEQVVERSLKLIKQRGNFCFTKFLKKVLSTKTAEEGMLKNMDLDKIPIEGPLGLLWDTEIDALK